MTVLALVEIRCDTDPPEIVVRDPGAPLLFADDAAAVRGDGVFETLFVAAGEVREQEAHLARLTRSAAALRLALPPPAVWRDATAALLAECDGEDLVVRLCGSRGRESAATPTCWATASAVPDSALAGRDGVRVVVLDRGLDVGSAAAPWLLSGAKTLSYAVNLAARRHADDLGVDDVVFRSPDGLVLEGPTSTVVVALPGRRLLTPPPEVGILAGTTQLALFREASAAGWECTYRRLTVPELHSAAGVWLLSSVRLAAPVREIDGAPTTVDEALVAELRSLLENTRPGGEKTVAHPPGAGVAFAVHEEGGGPDDDFLDT